jgi:hypothetical protein
MKRVLIFILLCPLGVVVPVAALGSSDLIANYGLFFFGLELAFLAGLPAAILCMIADWVLAKHGIPNRIVWASLVGFIAYFVTVLAFRGSPFIAGPCGAIPAAICSWLSSEKRV